MNRKIVNLNSNNHIHERNGRFIFKIRIATKAFERIHCTIDSNVLSRFEAKIEIQRTIVAISINLNFDETNKTENG